MLNVCVFSASIWYFAPRHSFSSLKLLCNLLKAPPGPRHYGACTPRSNTPCPSISSDRQHKVTSQTIQRLPYSFHPLSQLAPSQISPQDHRRHIPLPPSLIRPISVEVANLAHQSIPPPLIPDLVRHLGQRAVNRHG